MTGQRLRLVGSEPVPEPQSLRADQDLANQILTLDELHAADRIARMHIDAEAELDAAMQRCDREQTVRAIRKLVAINGLMQALANRLEGHT